MQVELNNLYPARHEVHMARLTHEVHKGGHITHTYTARLGNVELGHVE